MKKLRINTLSKKNVKLIFNNRKIDIFKMRYPKGNLEYKNVKNINMNGDKFQTDI